MEHLDSANPAEELRRATFTDLFLTQDHSLLEGIWQDGRARGALEGMVADGGAEMNARFLAAEILFAKLPGYPPAEGAAVLAEIYARALGDSTQAMANPWGLPGRTDATVAEHVLRIGPVAIPQFLPLLEDDRRVTYGGSRDATFGNRFRFRVKDVAADLIAALAGLPFVPDENPEMRDEAIRELAGKLKERGN